MNLTRPLLALVLSASVLGLAACSKGDPVVRDLERLRSATLSAEASVPMKDILARANTASTQEARRAAFGEMVSGLRQMIPKVERAEVSTPEVKAVKTRYVQALTVASDRAGEMLIAIDANDLPSLKAKMVEFSAAHAEVHAATKALRELAEVHGLKPSSP
jgi:hypothetical protein